jgi:hypothetical protein
MSSSIEVARAERLAPLCVGCVFALPVLLVAYPPMSDLPLHEAPIGLLRHWGDTAFTPPTLYMLNFGHANQLFSFVVMALSYLVPIAWASKLVVAASLVALPLAAARFADHVQAPRWSVLLVAPVGIGWLFFWGLVQNIVGLDALLWLLPTIDHFASKPTARGAAVMCAAMVGLHFAHQAMQLVACAAIVVCSIGCNWRPRALMLRSIPVVFCFALAAAANRYAWSVSGPRHTHVPLFLFYSFWHKIDGISGVLFAGYEPYIRHLLLALALGGVALLALSRSPADPAEGRARPPLPARLHAWRFVILGLLLFVVYLVAPANVQSTTLVYHRFLPPAWAILVIATSAGVTTTRPIARLACVVMPLASLLVAWPAFADSHRVYSDLDTFLDKIAIGSPIIGINLGPDPPHRLWNPSVAQGHIVAVRGGRSLFDYSQSPTSPITQRPEKQWQATRQRLEAEPFDLIPNWDFRHYRYLLISTTRPGLGEAVAMAIEDDARLIGQKGIWFLFESKLPVAPIDSPDEPLVKYEGPTLLQKLDHLAKSLREQGEKPAPDRRSPGALPEADAP